MVINFHQRPLAGFNSLSVLKVLKLLRRPKFKVFRAFFRSFCLIRFKITVVKVDKGLFQDVMSNLRGMPW